MDSISTDCSLSSTAFALRLRSVASLFSITDRTTSWSAYLTRSRSSPPSSSAANTSLSLSEVMSSGPRFSSRSTDTSSSAV